MALDLSNPDTLEAFRSGDRDVLAKLYREHNEAVRELLTRGFGFNSKGERIRFRGFREPFEIQEMMQDGFLRAFRQSAREKYDPSRPFRPYLITIVRNLVIDRHRRKTLERSLFATIGPAEGETSEEAVDRVAAGSDFAPPPMSPELEAFQKQLSTVLRAFIDTLDEADQRIINEHMMGELSQAAIADALEVDRNEIRKRIKNMREGLLRHLKREGFVSELDPADLFTAFLVLVLAR